MLTLERYKQKFKSNKKSQNYGSELCGYILYKTSQIKWTNIYSFVLLLRARKQTENVRDFKPHKQTENSALIPEFFVLFFCLTLFSTWPLTCWCPSGLCLFQSSPNATVPLPSFNSLMFLSQILFSSSTLPLSSKTIVATNNWKLRPGCPTCIPAPTFSGLNLIHSGQ